MRRDLSLSLMQLQNKPCNDEHDQHCSLAASCRLSDESICYCNKTLHVFVAGITTTTKTVSHELISTRPPPLPAPRSCVFESKVVAGKRLFRAANTGLQIGKRAFSLDVTLQLQSQTERSSELQCRINRQGS